ncbi:DUF952 domain-containing protein [Gluconacetobacter entanii]|uniref:DUF952 domain-containing protein n=1 Tax=Gluconacetobacter entanii TaxID=108528 RepID=A0ABT3KA25_9PROT|nr:DUF952 domain-containing protein [Gluconacetobacter entanii]MCW4592268.1 DUF952 domain-containing protein [Gluconacetobacter entanii]MCW4595723.1 DUF952 domain-containing protein [Gluconacetobacter entanii]NPC87482.1 DUF952 domain-containing protein [Gluconacetobacter entanii]
MTKETVYKILTAPEYDVLMREKKFSGSALDIVDGFIHMSTAAQVTATVDLYFKGQSGLMLAAIDQKGLGAALRWEPSRAGQLFPHFYGTLPSDAIIRVDPVTRNPDGTVKIMDG